MHKIYSKYVLILISSFTIIFFFINKYDADFFDQLKDNQF